MNAGAGGAGTALTPMAVLVLGLLAERQMHPYEMLQTLLARKADRFAKLRPGSLYHTVDRLCDRNLLQVSDVHREGNRPERTVYAITEAGQVALADALSAMLRTPAPEYPALYLALAEAHTLGRDEVVGLLDIRLETMRAELAAVDTGLSEALGAGSAEMFLLDAGCRRAVLDTQITWLAQLRTRLASGELMWLEEYRQLKNAGPRGGHPARTAQIDPSQNTENT